MTEGNERIPCGFSAPIAEGQNDIERRGDTTVIFLDYKGKRLECLVDTDCYPFVQDYHWFAVPVRLKGRKTFYAGTTVFQNGQPKILFMQDLIIAASRYPATFRRRMSIPDKKDY